MTVTIDSTTLDHDPVWTDKNAYPDLVAEAETSLSGKEIVSEATRGAHYPITLESTKDSGWLSGATVDTLRGYSRVKGATYVLNYGGVNYTIRFRNEVSGGAIQAELLRRTSNHGDATLYFGKIYLMCVG